MANPNHFGMPSKWHRYEGAPLSCWFCKREFWQLDTFTKHWCKYDVLRGYAGRGQPITPKTRIFPAVHLHLTDHDCALMLQSTWWEQARKIANKLETQHG